MADIYSAGGISLQYNCSRINSVFLAQRCNRIAKFSYCHKMSYVALAFCGKTTEAKIILFREKVASKFERNPFDRVGVGSN